VYDEPTVIDKLGYDESWTYIQIHGNIVQDSAGTLAEQISGHLDNAAIRADFDFANQVYSQIGISVIMPTGMLDQPVPKAVTFPLQSNATFDEISAITSRPWIGGTDVRDVPVFYVGGDEMIENYLDPNLQYVAVGRTREPGGGNTAGKEDGIVLAAGRFPDTLAHEMGHYLAGSFPEAYSCSSNWQCYYIYRDDDPDSAVHSDNPYNLMGGSGGHVCGGIFPQIPLDLLTTPRRSGINYA
jgi:hypothetical protein